MSGTSGGADRDGGSRGELLEDVRAQSETIGVVLILGMVILGMTAVIGFGSQALDATEERSEIANAEQAMAQFDSKAAQVALGDSGVQSMEFGRADGRYRVVPITEPGAGSITVTHSNFTGQSSDDDSNTIDEGSGDDDHTIYEGDFGTVLHENDGTTIAYQGGGVWRKDESGGSTVISPPEFHYRGGTLTFPIVQVDEGTGTLSASGAPTAVIDNPTSSPVYPAADGKNSYAPYPNPPGGSFNNSIENGEIIVTVTSEYHRSWAEYFRTRTEGDVTVSDPASPGDPGTVTLELISPGDKGYIDYTGEGHTINTRGIKDHSLTQFDTTLVPDETDSADFSNLQWSMYAENGDRQFEIHLRRTSGNACDNTEVGAVVYYSPPDGDSDDSDPYQGWFDSDAFTTECYDADGDGISDEVRLVANFIDDADAESTDPQLKYTSLASSDLQHFSPSGSSLIDTADTPKFDHDGVPWEPKSYSSGDLETIDRLVNHYISLMGPEVELTTDDKNSDSVNDDASSAFINYPPSGRVITFLHVTENEIRVEFN
jgi:hypothetical protein